MSIRVMTQVWDCDRYEGGALLVLLAMADWAADDGSRVFPTVAKLAKKARLTERGVQKCLKKLSDDGIITLVAKASGKKRLANEWRINLDYLNDVHPTLDEADESGTIGVETSARPGDSSLTLESSGTSDGVEVGRTEFTQQIENQESVEEFTPKIDVPEGCTAICATSELPPETDEQSPLTGELCNSHIDEPSFQPPSQPLSHPPSGARANDLPKDETKEMPAFLRRFQDPDFHRFLRAYPETDEGPAQTFKAWKATESIRPPIDDLLAAVAYCITKKVNENRIRPPDDQGRHCHASRWLNEQRWLLNVLKPAPPPGDDPAAKMAARRHAWGSHPAVEELCAEVGEGMYDTLFAVCRLSFVEGTALLTAPSKFRAEKLEAEYGELLAEKLKCPVVYAFVPGRDAVAA